MSSLKRRITGTVTAALLFGSVGFVIHFVYARSTHGSARAAEIHGQVDSIYGAVKNARVRLPGSDGYVLTDSDGRFVLKSSHPPGKRLLLSAGKQGWFNKGVVAVQGGPESVINLNPVYLDDQKDYRFISPVTCSRCHVKLSRYWDRSKMAHTTSNPKVLDMYYGTAMLKQQGVGPGYLLDNPGSPGDCAQCHAPSSAASKRGSRDLQTALFSPLTEWDGISCDYCHKIRKVVKDSTKPSGMAALLERQTPVRGSSILVFGPYDDVVAPPMAASYNPIYDQGVYCSVCHSHFRQTADGKPWDWQAVYSAAEWKGFGIKEATKIPVQTTYQEWKMWQDQLPADDTNKGKKCQDCHMSWRKEMLPYDNYIIDGHARDMWGTRRSPENIRPHHFDGGTETQLKTALSMELEGEITGKTLLLRVYVTNTNGGHWVPTGETMRSVMLLLEASDSQGRPLPMIRGERLPDWAGKGKEANGNYAGRPGAVFARILKDDRGNIHVPFWRATGVAADNRIRPKTTLTLEYEFALRDENDEPTAEARLIYRPVHSPLAMAKGWEVEDIPIASVAW